MLVADDGSLAGLWFDLHSDTQKALAAEHGVTRERFTIWARDNFRLRGIAIDGAMRGVIATGKVTLHVAVHPSIKGRWLRDLELVLREVLAAGPIVVATDAQDKQACAFIERAGGVPLEESGRVKRYKIELQQMWFQRSKRHGRTS